MITWRSIIRTGSCPGVGISIGLTRLFYVLGEQGLLNPALPVAPCDVIILPMGEEMAPAIQLATQFRAAGHPGTALRRAEEIQGEAAIRQ